MYNIRSGQIGMQYKVFLRIGRFSDKMRLHILKVRGLLTCDEVRTVTMSQNTSAVIIYANLCFFFSSKEYIVLGQVK